MESYDWVTSWIRDAGFYATTVEQLKQWKRITLAARRRVGGGYSGNSFWLTHANDVWVLGTWGGLLYRFPSIQILQSFCVEILSDRPDEVLTEIDSAMMTRLGITELSDAEFDKLVAAG